MKDSPLTLAIAAFVLVIGCAALSAFVKSRNQPVYHATPKLIAAEPDFFFEKSVRLRTTGMERIGDELRYRKATDQPYCVVLRGKFPDPIPEFVLCFCEGTKDGLTVLICR